MTLKMILARLSAFFSGGHVGETLSNLSAAAQADYDIALTRAHQVLADAKSELGKVAVTELECLEGLIEAAKRRALALEGAKILPSKAHGARLEDVIGKIA